LEYSKEKPTLALIKSENLKYFPNALKLWEGRLYIKGSESRFAVFLKYVYKALRGDMSGFQDRVLIYIPKWYIFSKLGMKAVDKIPIYNYLEICIEL